MSGLMSIAHMYPSAMLFIGTSTSDAVAKKEYCSVKLTEAKYKAFVYAIRNHYWYQMYIGEWLVITGVGGLCSDQ